MNLRDLDYLVAVADLRNFSLAAEQCHVSQPTLSNQIKKLEEYLGVTIFERNNKRVLLTETGEQIINAARRVLWNAQDIRDVAAHAKDPLTGRFRLGAFPTLASYFFPQIVPQIQTLLPSLQLVLVEEKTETLLAQLKNGQIDAALLALPVADEQLISQKLFEDIFYLAVPAAHTLASQSLVRFSDLASNRLMLLDEGHCLRDQALEVCHLSGHGMEEDFRATSLETLRQMVKAGTGITLMPEIAILNEKEEGIRYIPFEDPAPRRSIGLVWRKTSSRMPIINRLTNLFSL